MKRVYQLPIIAFTLYIMATLVSCADNDYKKACEEHDFIKAYQIVDRLKDGAGCSAETDQALTAEQFVVTQEALYALEQGEDFGLKRIAYIAKDRNARWLYGDLEELARQMGDKELAEKLSNINPYKLRIDSHSVDGILNGYFEVIDTVAIIIDKKFEGGWDNIREAEEGKYVTVQLKKTKNGMPKPHNDKIYYEIYIDFMDKDGIVLLHHLATFGALKDYSDAGNVLTIDFKIYPYQATMCKLKVSSEFFYHN